MFSCFFTVSMSKYILSFLSSIGFAGSFGKLCCLTLPTAQASQGLIIPGITVQFNVFAIFQTASSPMCPNCSWAYWIVIFFISVAFFAISSKFACFRYIANTVPLGVGILILNVNLCSPFSIQILSVFPKRRHLLFCIFEILNKLNFAFCKCETSHI